MTTTIFLIMEDIQKQRALAADLSASGLIVNEYTTVREFLLDKPNHKRGIVFSEVSLPGLSGLSLIETLAEERNQFPVVLLASRREIPTVIQSTADFMVKPVDAETIKKAAERTVKPKKYDEKKLRWGFEHLTPREHEVLQHIAEGKTSVQIAGEIGMKQKTVEALRVSLYAKTRAQDAGELLRLWRAWKEMEKK